MGQLDRVSQGIASSVIGDHIEGVSQSGHLGSVVVV